MSSTTGRNRLVAARQGSRALLDVALVLGTLAGSLMLASHGGVAPPRSGTAELDLVAAVLVVCSTIPLITWRAFPLGVFAATATASVLLAGIGYPLVVLGPAVALYLLAVSREQRGPWTWPAAATVLGLFAAYVAAATALADGAFPALEVTHTSLAWAVAWFAGERTRLRAEQIAELEERALHAERDVERERLLAAAEERARIARDLHDCAGHAINVIAVRAGAARLRHHQDPERSLLALEAIEEVARHTLEDIDHMVSTLRDRPTNGTVEAPVGLASLDTLLQRHAAAGLEVDLAESGPRRPLGAAADQGTYRILQEALTNAARHGTGSARVELNFGDTAVDLTVTNPVTPNAPSPTGGRHGLIGMRERATLFGGRLDAKRANGQFRIHAHIPYGGPR